MIMLFLNQMCSFVPRLPFSVLWPVFKMEKPENKATRINVHFYMLDIATNCWKMHVKCTNMYISLVHKVMLTDTGGIDIEYKIHYFKNI